MASRISALRSHLRKSFLCLVCLICLPAFAGEPVSVVLWQDGAPGEKEAVGPEMEVQRNDERKTTRITNVSIPTLTVYPPPAERNAHTAVLVCPGGGYSYVVVDKEGTEAVTWLNSLGITGVLLKYRVPTRPHDPGHQLPLQDGQRALGLLRARAEEFGVKPERIGVLGFSAGGHLAAMLSTNYDRRTYAPVAGATEAANCRPDFTLLLYPAYLTVKAEGDKLAPELRVNKQTPPAFLMQTQDDSVRVESSLYYYLALKNAGVPGELHIYPSGGHGYGMRLEGHTAATWPKRAEEWLRAGGWCLP